MEKVYFNTEQEALNAELEITNQQKNIWTDGITSRWCKPQQDLDEDGLPIDTKWFILIKQTD